ncbi:hypothetical protein [Burkholderia glumae]
MTLHEKNPPHVSEGQPGVSGREASTGVDEPPSSTLPADGGGSNATQGRAADLTNDQILSIAKHHFHVDHSTAPETLGTDSEAAGVRAVAHALRGIEAGLAADLPDSEGGEA